METVGLFCFYRAALVSFYVVVVDAVVVGHT